MGASLYQSTAAASAEGLIKSQCDADARWSNAVREAGTISEEPPAPIKGATGSNGGPIAVT